MEQRLFNYWLRYKLSTKSEIDRFFEDIRKLSYYIEKHNIKEEDIIFVKSKINKE